MTNERRNMTFSNKPDKSSRKASYHYFSEPSSMSEGEYDVNEIKRLILNGNKHTFLPQFPIKHTEDYQLQCSKMSPTKTNSEGLMDDEERALSNDEFQNQHRISETNNLLSIPESIEDATALGNVTRKESYSNTGQHSSPSHSDSSQESNLTFLVVDSDDDIVLKENGDVDKNKMEDLISSHVDSYTNNLRHANHDMEANYSIKKSISPLSSYNVSSQPSRRPKHKHARKRSGDNAAAQFITGGNDWAGMKEDDLPLPVGISCGQVNDLSAATTTTKNSQQTSGRVRSPPDQRHLHSVMKDDGDCYINRDCSDSDGENKMLYNHNNERCRKFEHEPVWRKRDSFYEDWSTKVTMDENERKSKEEKPQHHYSRSDTILYNKLKNENSKKSSIVITRNHSDDDNLSYTSNKCDQINQGRLKSICHRKSSSYSGDSPSSIAHHDYDSSQSPVFSWLTSGGDESTFLDNIKDANIEDNKNVEKDYSTDDLERQCNGGESKWYEKQVRSAEKIKTKNNDGNAPDLSFQEKSDQNIKNCDFDQDYLGDARTSPSMYSMVLPKPLPYHHNSQKLTPVAKSSKSGKSKVAQNLSPNQRSSSFFPNSHDAYCDDQSNQKRKGLNENVYRCPNCGTKQTTFCSTGNVLSQDENYLRRFIGYFAFCIIASLFVFGFQAGWGPLDSFYFAIITFTSIGFGDYAPTSIGSRIACALCIFISVFCICLFFGTLLAKNMDNGKKRKDDYRTVNNCFYCQLVNVNEEEKENQSMINHWLHQRHDDCIPRPNNGNNHHVVNYSLEGIAPDTENGIPSDLVFADINSMKKDRCDEKEPLQQQLDPPISNSLHVFSKELMEKEHLLSSQKLRPYSVDTHYDSLERGSVEKPKLKKHNSTGGRGTLTHDWIEGNNYCESYSSFDPKQVKKKKMSKKGGVRRSINQNDSSSMNTHNSMRSRISLKSNQGQRFVTYVTATMRKAMLRTMILLIIGSTAFSVIENLNIYDSFYFTVVLSTSVGYGDITPHTPQGKLFVIGYVVIAGIFFMESMAKICMIPIELRRRRVEHEDLLQFGDELDNAALWDFASGPIVERLSTSNQGAEIPTECTREMFALAMLVRLGRISEQDVKNAFVTFTRLDINKRGTLSSKEILETRNRNIDLTVKRNKKKSRKTRKDSGSSSSRQYHQCYPYSSQEQQVHHHRKSSSGELSVQWIDGYVPNTIEEKSYNAMENEKKNHDCLSRAKANGINSNDFYDEESLAVTQKQLRTRGSRFNFEQ